MPSKNRLKAVLVLLAALGLVSLGVQGGYLLLLWHGDAAVRETYVPQPGGSLMICGGGAVPEEVCQCFLDLAGGSRARLAIIPSYDPSPKETAQLIDSWRNRGVASVFVLHAGSRSQSDDPAFAKPLAEVTGVWLSGGRQSHLSERYVDTEVERQLKALLDRKGVIGGASAGAAAMTRLMIGGGLSEAVQQRGFDLLPGMVVDQHFLYRNRLQRLLGILTAHPGLIGLGIDERTAVLVQRKGRICVVLGESYAVVCLPQEQKFPRIEILKAGDHTDLEVLKERPGEYAISSPAALKRFLEAAPAR
jgi:cyanophycinase